MICFSPFIKLVTFGPHPSSPSASCPPTGSVITINVVISFIIAGLPPVILEGLLGEPFFRWTLAKSWYESFHLLIHLLHFFVRLMKNQEIFLKWAEVRQGSSVEHFWPQKWHRGWELMELACRSGLDEIRNPFPGWETLLAQARMEWEIVWVDGLMGWWI